MELVRLVWAKTALRALEIVGVLFPVEFVGMEFVILLKLRLRVLLIVVLLLLVGGAQAQVSLSTDLRVWIRGMTRAVGRVALVVFVVYQKVRGLLDVFGINLKQAILLVSLVRVVLVTAFVYHR